MNKFPYPYTKEAGERFIAFATNDNPVHIMAIEIDGKAVGYWHSSVDGRRMQKCRNGLSGWQNLIGVKGIITAAVRQMIDYGFTKL
jgi:hypothetical protein